MVSRILHTSYVIDFLDIDFDSDKISEVLKQETDLILERLNIELLKDWEVQFKAVYGNKFPIRVFKKLPAYKKERQKLIVIHIPIPLKEVAQWGVEPNQHIQIGSHPNEEKYVNRIDVNPNDFNNRTDYILDCMRRGIKFCFEDGFTVNGIKIKL